MNVHALDKKQWISNGKQSGFENPNFFPKNFKHLKNTIQQVVLDWLNGSITFFKKVIIKICSFTLYYWKKIPDDVRRQIIFIVMSAVIGRAIWIIIDTIVPIIAFPFKKIFSKIGEIFSKFISFSKIGEIFSKFLPFLKKAEINEPIPELILEPSVAPEVSVPSSKLAFLKHVWYYFYPISQQVIIIIIGRTIPPHIPPQH